MARRMTHLQLDLPIDLHEQVARLAATAGLTIETVASGLILNGLLLFAVTQPPADKAPVSTN